MTKGCRLTKQPIYSEPIEPVKESFESPPINYVSKDSFDLLKQQLDEVKKDINFQRNLLLIIIGSIILGSVIIATKSKHRTRRYHR